MSKIQISISEVFKKDLRLIGFLILNGLVAYALQKLNADPEMALIFGAAANYIAYRVMQEIKNEGYGEALRELR